MRSNASGPDKSETDQDSQNVTRRIERQILFARLALFFESLLPAAAPLLAVAAAFVGLSWMGFWSQAPVYIHIPLLLLFFLGFLWAAASLRSMHWPGRESGRRRVETASGLTNRPLEALDDSLAAGSAKKTTRALWNAHRARAVRSLGRLRFQWPSPRITLSDGYAWRLAAAILLYIGAFVGNGSYGELIGEAFRFDRPASDAGLRIDAWVTPPAYTGHPPIFLDMDKAAGMQAAGEAIRIPAGSLAFIRAQGVRDMEVAYATESGERKIAAVDDAAEVIAVRAGGRAPKGPVFTTHEVMLDKDGAVAISAAGGPLAQWRFEVVEDVKPEIEMLDPPEVQVSGAVKLTYSMTDDYGVIGARALLTAKEESITFAAETSEVRPLVAAPDFKLSLPQRRTKSGAAQTFRDLTSHPWAGSLVEIALQARDEAGQIGQSPVTEFRLPSRNFSKPMARAIVEQRRNLALDVNRRLQVLDAFDALMIAPERFIDNASIYLGMRFVYRRLQEAEEDADLLEALDVMWDLALGIEDGDLSLAERALREAEEALRRALENGAPDEEIERLTQALREALNEYFQALAEQMRRNPGETMPVDPNAQTLRQQDLEQMLKQIEDLARTGAHDAAREMLSQMQQMLENLRAGRPQMQQGKSANQMSDALNKLGEMIQRQRELMDKSFRLDQDGQRQRGQQRQGQERNGEQQPGEGSSQQDLAQQLAEALRQLQQGQGDLQQSLEQLLQQLEQDGVRPNEALKDAGRAMGRAEGALGKGEPGNAVGPQGEALQALQQGAKGLVEQMINQGQGQGTADGRGDPRNTDPLGRPNAPQREVDGRDTLPGEIDIQRARRILQQLRQKLGDPLRSETERNYIERLLTPY